MLEREPNPSVSTSSSSSFRYDPRVIQALEAYLAATEAGTRPDRDAFLAAHADIALPLADCLAGMEALRGVLGGPSGGARAPSAIHELIEVPTPPFVLGDYRLERELGRGGMGIVYEAWQESLDRRVAVKVLPMAATLDPRQLQRFRTEARVAASLQHEGIVPVYSVGCENGIHYFAMRLIDGFSLASLIDAWRSPSAGCSPPRGPSGDAGEGTLDDGHLPAIDRSRSLPGPPDRRAFIDLVTSIGIQAAEALEHAHGTGVLHRDIKPANLLLDDDGHLWITDFGLARMQAKASLTHPGDLIGTLRYMSPEQALGRHDRVDCRSDVYSLGATLYEILTRIPLFEGSDVHELVGKVVDTPPVPPRRIDPAIPRDLETIVLKALSKDPVDRYESAEAMAEDLRRFRDDRPIRARRPSAAERLTRWSRRHRTAVYTAAVLMVAALVAQSVTIMLLTLEGRRSQANAQRASDASLRMYDMADALYQQIAEQLGPDPAEAGPQRRLLVAALDLYEQFAHDAEYDPDLATRVASALRKAGDIHLRLGHHTEAAVCYGRVLELNRAHDARAPKGIERDDELAHVHHRLGKAYAVTGDLDRAAESLSQAVEHQERWLRLRNRPDDRLTLITYLMDLGRVAGPEGGNRASERALGHALALADELAAQDGDPSASPGLLDQVNALRNLIEGLLLRSHRRFAAAESSERSALALYDRLAAAYPDRSEFRRRRSSVAMNLAWSLATCPDTSTRDEAGAIELVRDALLIDPSNIDLAVDAGVFFMRLDRFDEAERIYRDALVRAGDRADICNNLAWLLTTHPAQGRRDPEEAVRLAEAAVQRAPNVGGYWNTLGVAHYRAGRFKEALASLETSMELSGGGDGFDWFFVAMTLWQLGDHDTAVTQYARAIDWMDLRSTHAPELNRFREEADSTIRA